MRSNALLLSFVTLAISATAAPLKQDGARDASALVGRSHEPRYHQAKGDYHPLPRELSDRLDGESSFQQTRRAAGDVDVTKLVDLNNNDNSSDQSGQGGNTKTGSGSGSGPSPWQLNESIQSANKGSGATMPTGACHSSGGCASDPSALSLQGLGPGGPGQLGLPTKAFDTLPTDGSAGNSTSTGGPSADNASPDASKQDTTNNTTTTTLTTATTPTPAPAPTAPAPAPVVGSPLPMNLLATALIDIIRAFEKATTATYPSVTTSLATAPAPTTTPAPAPVPTPSNTTAPDATSGNTSDDANAADSAATGADSADPSAQDDSAGSRRGLSEADGIDGPFKWIVMRGNGAKQPELGEEE